MCAAHWSLVQMSTTGCLRQVWMGDPSTSTPLKAFPPYTLLRRGEGGRPSRFCWMLAQRLVVFARAPSAESASMTSSNRQCRCK